jgi:hypothetical protein
MPLAIGPAMSDGTAHAAQPCLVEARRSIQGENAKYSAHQTVANKLRRQATARSVIVFFVIS